MSGPTGSGRETERSPEVRSAGAGRIPMRFRPHEDRQRHLLRVLIACTATTTVLLLFWTAVALWMFFQVGLAFLPAATLPPPDEELAALELVLRDFENIVSVFPADHPCRAAVAAQRQAWDSMVRDGYTRAREVQFQAGLADLRRCIE